MGGKIVMRNFSGLILFGVISTLALIYPVQAKTLTVLSVDTSTDNVGIGTKLPLRKLHVSGGYIRVDGLGGEAVLIGGDGRGSDVEIGSSNPEITRVSLYNTENKAWMRLIASSIQLTGGADLAEAFKVSNKALVKPGMVVSIDLEHAGRLMLSQKAYDSKVAGIISGAKGVQPGLIMNQDDVFTDGTHPVALAGRVYAWADASFGSIKPGDLLTTSDHLGHIMKASDRHRSHGAIIGKAMSSLERGTGLILVLVSLQ